MILEMNKGNIKILENSCERSEGCQIYLRFADRVITNKTEIKMYINDKQIEQIKPNIWNMDGSLHTGEESIVVVTVNNNGYSEIYQGVFVIKNYLSFGELGENKFPQVLLDMNKKIKTLEDRVKILESKSTVI
jgi:hypothetical protein